MERELPISGESSILDRADGHLFFNALRDAKQQVLDILLNEYWIIYECKVCFSLFRNMSPLITHKQACCKSHSVYGGEDDYSKHDSVSQVDTEEMTAPNTEENTPIHQVITAYDKDTLLYGQLNLQQEKETSTEDQPIGQEHEDNLPNNTKITEQNKETLPEDQGTAQEKDISFLGNRGVLENLSGEITSCCSNSIKDPKLLMQSVVYLEKLPDDIHVVGDNDSNRNKRNKTKQRTHDGKHDHVEPDKDLTENLICFEQEEKKCYKHEGFYQHHEEPYQHHEQPYQHHEESSILTKLESINNPWDKVLTIMDKENIKCLLCQKEFQSNSRLCRHATKHCHWRRFQCKFCSFASYALKHVKKHVMSEHPRENIVDFTDCRQYVLDLAEQYISADMQDFSCKELNPTDPCPTLSNNTMDEISSSQAQKSSPKKSQKPKKTQRKTKESTAIATVELQVSNVEQPLLLSPGLSEVAPDVSLINMESTKPSIRKESVVSIELQMSEGIQKTSPMSHSNFVKNPDKNPQVEKTKTVTRFDHETRMSEWIKQHSDDKTLTCLKCGRKFQALCTLRSHVRQHSDTKQYKCRLCSQQHHYYSQIVRHIHESHGQMYSKVPSVVVDLFEPGENSLDEEEPVAWTPLLIPCSTPTEPNSYFIGASAQRIIGDVRLRDNPQKLTSDGVGTAAQLVEIKDEPSSNDHTNTANDNPETVPEESLQQPNKGPWKCEICGLLVNNERSYHNHVSRVHLGMKRYKCGLCDYVAFQQSDVRIHIKKKHHKKQIAENVIRINNTLESSTLSVAEEINKTINDEYHEDSADTEQIIAERNKLMDDENDICVQCGVQVEHGNKRHRHVSRHMGLVPFRCCLCDFMSYDSHAVLSHAKSSHSELVNFEDTVLRLDQIQRGKKRKRKCCNGEHVVSLPVGEHTRINL